MILWNALLRRVGASRPEPFPPRAHWLAVERPTPDLKRVMLLIGLAGLSWVATYVGMLELIQANLGDLPLMHKAIVGLSCAMLMIMVVWLLDRMFAPVGFGTRLSYIAGYLFLSIISVGFGFGFYWKVPESQGVAARSGEGAITQVQGDLFGARLVQMLDLGPAHRDTGKGKSNFVGQHFRARGYFVDTVGADEEAKRT
jgi:hypothetical protein